MQAGRFQRPGCLPYSPMLTAGIGRLAVQRRPSPAGAAALNPPPVPVQAPAPRPCPAWFGRGARRRHCPVQAALSSPPPSPKANAYTANWTLPHDEATMAGGIVLTKARPRGGRA